MVSSDCVGVCGCNGVPRLEGGGGGGGGCSYNGASRLYGGVVAMVSPDCLGVCGCNGVPRLWGVWLQ